ncbi:MAG TPA: hypothetical protein VLM40_08975, partial [Gemmata sp.]|nr:hypothetical protein [Gemmata sp.]
QGARRLWQGVIAVFAPVATQDRWVDLARLGIEQLDRLENRGNRPPPNRTALESAIANAKALDGEKRIAAFRALEDLFRDDPAALDLIHAAQIKK